MNLRYSTVIPRKLRACSKDNGPFTSLILLSKWLSGSTPAADDLCRPIRDAITRAVRPRSRTQREEQGKFVWTEECEAALQQLKEELIKRPVFVLPDPEKPYTLFTDASKYAAGLVLCQQDEQGDFHVVLYDSVALPRRRNPWSTRRSSGRRNSSPS